MLSILAHMAGGRESFVFGRQRWFGQANL
jgi:hypothetical protein